MSFPSDQVLVDTIIATLEKGGALDLRVLELERKTMLADRMVIASGRSERHVGALSDQLLDALRKIDIKGIRPEGRETCGWIVVDAGAVICHLFRPEVRDYYNLERLWSDDRPRDGHGLDDGAWQAGSPEIADVKKTA